ncbi:MAG TPA: NYN domain-containing protein [Gemmataceae bacterium]|nr:NYN domain-containing protein [Gemmataceae bacterium]
MNDGDRSLAIYIDFENLALGFQGRRDRFDIERVLERLVEKGKIVCKKAYADWSRFSSFTTQLHEAAIELIEIPRRAQSGKNSADIRLCVDAMDLAYSKEHINTFVIVSGDSDFSPLVSKLKELGKHVIGLGMQESTSDLLRDNCDEFIYYEDLGKTTTLTPALDAHLPETKRKAFALLLESLLALRRENKEVLWSSMVKDTMKRKKPSFNESYHGYRTFSELLEDAQKEGLLELETDKRSRTYVVTRFGDELRAETAAAAAPAKKKSRRRRSSAKKKAAAETKNGSSPLPEAPLAEAPAPSEHPAEASQAVEPTIDDADIRF